MSGRAPLGVKIVTALGAIGSLLALLGGVALVGLSGQAAGGASGLIAGLGLLVLVLAVAQLVALYGLINLTSWGYTWTMGLYGLSIVLNLVSIASGAGNQVVALLVNLVIVGYLYSVRDVFGASTRSVPDAHGTDASRSGHGRR